MNVFKMGWRNVWRNKRRSAVTIAALAFALCVELLYAGLLPGYIQGMEEDVVDLEIGDIQISEATYFDTPSLYTTIDRAVVDKVEAAGMLASPRLMGGGLGASGDASAGVSLRGIDVARDLKASGISGKVKEGEWLDPTDLDGVVIGRRLARNLDAQPGSELLILSQAADGSMANDLYEVRGILAGIAEGTDRSAVYMNEQAFRDLMVLDEGVHQVVVRRGEIPLEEAEATLEGILGEGYNIMTWKEIMPMVAQMLESTQGVIYIVFFIIYLAVGILILNAMLTAVFERIKEFGVLKALGAGPLRVFSLIMVESAIQSTVAMGLGILMALPGMFYLMKYGINVGSLGGMDTMGVAMRSQWFGIYDPPTLAGPLIMLWVVVGMAVIWPAVKASFISPIRAMRHR